MSTTQSVSEPISSPAELSAALSYGRALRAIGQDLAPLFPKVLAIETDGIVFEARGECHPNPFEVIKESIFLKSWNKLFGKKSPPEPTQTQTSAVSFSRSYGPADIDRLDQLHSAQRTENFRKADIYSLAERLRTMGAIVDSKKARLKYLGKEADRLVVEYWDAQGQLQSAKITTVILYRNQQQFDRQRRNVPSELWEGYDF
jgi:hypothetical protein